MVCPKHFAKQFVHLTGGMFLKYDPNQKSFIWAWNHMLSQSYRSQTSTTEELLDFLLLDFRNFCKDVDGRLSVFIRKVMYGLDCNFLVELIENEKM